MADQKSGHVEVICGCMFSGKTEELIRRLRRAGFAHQVIQVFSHSLDIRYGEAKVASHNGLDWQAVAVSAADQILVQLDPKATVVAIDEAQFFDRRITGVAQTLAESGRRVIVAGLDLDFRGEPFGPMPLLVVQADRVDKLSAICVVCGGPATRTQRLINGQPAPYDSMQIQVGGKNAYEARCRHCHEVPGKP